MLCTHFLFSFNTHVCFHIIVFFTVETHVNFTVMNRIGWKLESIRKIIKSMFDRSGCRPTEVLNESDFAPNCELLRGVRTTRLSPF